MLKRTALTGLQIITILAVITFMVTSAARAAVPQIDLGTLKSVNAGADQDTALQNAKYFKKGHGHRGFKKRGFRGKKFGHKRFGHKRFGHKRHFGHRKFGHKRHFGHRKFGHKRKFGHRSFGHRKFGHGNYGHRSYGHRSHGHKHSSHKYSGQKYYGHGSHGYKKHGHKGYGHGRYGHGRYGHGGYGHKPVVIFKFKSAAPLDGRSGAAFTPAVNRIQQGAPKRHHLIAETTAVSKTPEAANFDYGASAYPDSAPKNHGHNFRNKSTRLKDVPKGITRPRPATQKFNYGNSSFKPSAPKNHGHDFRN